jgi:hypothetical protein
VITGSARVRASFSTLSNQMVSFALSWCVTTSSTRTSWSSSTDRQRTPTLW